MKKGFFLPVWATESFTEALSLFLSPNTRRRDREEEKREAPCKKMAQGGGSLISARDFPFSLELCPANRHGRHSPSLACGQQHQSERPISAGTLGWSRPV